MAAERLYRIHAVSQMVGLSESLLRAWERRYQVLAPRRMASGYRGYTSADVELLRRVKRLTEEGVSIGDVGPLLPDIRRAARLAAEVVTLVPQAALSTPAPERLAGWRLALLAAVEASAQDRMDQVLDEALAGLPPLEIMEGLMVPVLREVGERWHAGALNVSQEHLLTHAIRTRLLTLIHGAPRSARRHAVCACFPEEDHDLGLLMVAYRLRQGGYRVTYLGPRTPFDQLEDLSRRLKPDLVALSQVSQLPAKDMKRLVQQAVAAVGRAPVLIGGAGASAHAELIAGCGATVVGPSDWARLAA